MTAAVWQQNYGADSFDAGFADASNSSVWTDLSGVSGTPTVANDATVMFDDAATTKVSVPAGSTRVEIGVSSGISKPIGWNGSTLWALRFPSNGIARLQSVSNTFGSYLGDGSYTNFWVDSIPYPPSSGDYGAIVVDDWLYLVSSPDLFAATGSPTLAGTARGKLRILLNAGDAFDFHVGYWGPVPRSRPKVICIFDDGYESFYTRVYPDALTYGIPCATAVVKDYVGTSDVGTFASVAQLREMVEDATGLFECVNHSTNNDGFTDLGSSIPDQMSRYLACANYLLDNGLSRRGSERFIVYVKGQYTSDLAVALRAAGYLAARGVYTARYVPPTHYAQGALRKFALPIVADCSVTGTATGAGILTLVDKAIQYRSDCFLMFHDVVAAGASGQQILQSEVQALFAGLRRRKVSGLCDLALPSKWAMGLTQPALVA